MKKNVEISLLLAALILLVISVLVFNMTVKGVRRTFVFPSVEKDHFIVETRRISLTEDFSLSSKSKMETEVEYYIKETLLGPQTERSRRLFPRETKLLSCFSRNKILYVDFSGDIINPEESAKMLPLRQSMDLLEKNIKRNFRHITKVEFFVNGNKAYDGY